MTADQIISFADTLEKLAASLIEKEDSEARLIESLKSMGPIGSTKVKAGEPYRTFQNDTKKNF